MAEVTWCAICGKEIAYDPELFAAGQTGEPVCSDCRAVEDEVTDDGS